MIFQYGFVQKCVDEVQVRSINEMRRREEEKRPLGKMRKGAGGPDTRQGVNESSEDWN